MSDSFAWRKPDWIKREHNESGFTFIEVVIVIALIGFVAALAANSYSRYIANAKVARAIAEISAIGNLIDGLHAFGDSKYPNSLSELDVDTPTDPWGWKYHYLRIEGVFDVSSNAPLSELPAVAADAGDRRPSPDKPRKDRFFKPISTDYDLYSSGPNGDSRESLEHRDSHDDVVRGLNGKFIGPAARF